MTINLEKRVKIIVADVLKIPLEQVTVELAIGDIPEWDSVANIRLLQKLEEIFDIEIDAIDALEADDVFDFFKLVENYIHPDLII
tara:strand:+ start:240 stop:494 length:255 start_codon:yes stop_codon:yes gene_type:complete